MKTTFDIPDELFRRAKKAALERGTSLKAVVTVALERELGPAEHDIPPLQTLIWPPPETVTELVDPDVVLQAIRALRDGIPGDWSAADVQTTVPNRRASDDK